MADPQYETWLARREIDRMPDPHRNPCEAVEAEIERLRELLVFADGAAVTGLGLALADLYASDCEWAQETLARAGCHPRGTVAGRQVIPDRGEQ